mgnify:FL=1
MNKQQLANKIWESANRMRSKIEANEYKDYILGFIFYKFLSDKEVEFLKKDGYEVTIENMMDHLSDIAGIRIICSFTSDIYQIADMIAAQGDITVLHVKDYIQNPKPNGYKSYHMVVTVP